LAPELFTTTAQDAKFTIYWHWCSHIAHVLLNSIQIQNNMTVQILKGFHRDYILERNVYLTKKLEIWLISQFLYHQRYPQYFYSWRSSFIYTIYYKGIIAEVWNSSKCCILLICWYTFQNRTPIFQKVWINVLEILHENSLFW
jgi:hypothetical protein